MTNIFELDSIGFQQYTTTQVSMISKQVSFIYSSKKKHEKSMQNHGDRD